MGALTALDMLALGGAILHARMPQMSAAFAADRGLCLGGVLKARKPVLKAPDVSA
jgi:hypothetical protein